MGLMLHANDSVVRFTCKLKGMFEPMKLLKPLLLKLFVLSVDVIGNWL